MDYDAVAQLPGFEHADLETVTEILDEAGNFMAEVVAPTNRAGDLEGSKLNSDGSVTTATGFKEAYSAYVDAGWGSVPLPEAFGGGGFPRTIGLALQELMATANMAFALAPLLTQGAIEALLHYGSDEQKQQWLPKMVTGEWAGTMNLTEPHAGTDVGALTTKAVKRDDGTYAISGQKIFITFGDHDLSEQIVHLVLARTPDAPAGTKGISIFIVPKFLMNDDGSVGERNGVHTVGVEHKMGIHGSPTCVLSYEDATGYLVGEENIGMRIMFVMMNSARLSVGMQGLAVSERAYQQSLDYARERIQGRAIGATQDSPIIDFPDVRRMLMTQKAYIAAMRRMMLLTATYTDVSTHHPDAAVRARANEIVGLLTPINKSFGTDLGNELTSLALQIHGGMGFIEETGAAQHYRDVRIAAIYEGTNGVQAADLVGRKLPVRDGASALEFIASMRELDASSPLPVRNSPRSARSSALSSTPSSRPRCGCSAPAPPTRTPCSRAPRRTSASGVSWSADGSWRSLRSPLAASTTTGPPRRSCRSPGSTPSSCCRRPQASSAQPPPGRATSSPSAARRSAMQQPAECASDPTAQHDRCARPFEGGRFVVRRTDASSGSGCRGIRSARCRSARCRSARCRSTRRRSTQSIESANSSATVAILST
ncbi:Acyl-CoA dehydrogenase [Agromyces cerinus subsp. cerinus]|uniref:3-methylmercaptopropionyl-CoA dehydrogenase n=1 Tax=Agromyces cerinus subsp. cerinus TaxID=232089 RepID=A0A1N6IAS2_9MICO|nr:Acyl-CoA dehydrogenase [Agromyces cerinus subsp. cerinus]